MVVGADASANHPVIAIRFRRAMSRGARIIVINPKRVELCDQADLWIQQRPGTDVALFNAMARVILDEGLAESRLRRARAPRASRSGGRSLARVHARAAPRRSPGSPPRDIAQAARWYARPAVRRGSCLIWGMGITQHTNGIHNAHALLNLSLVDGTARRSRLAGSRRCAARTTSRAAATPAASRPTSPAISTTRRPRSPSSSAAWGVGRPRRPGLVVTEMVEGCLDRRQCARCTSSAKTRSCPSRICITREGDRPARLPRRPGPVHARDGGARATSSCPRRRSPRRRGPSPTPSAACSACAPRCRRPARRGPTGGSPPSSPSAWPGASASTSAASSTTRSASEIFDEMARLIAVPGRPLPRAARSRGRAAVAVPDGRPPGHAATSTPIPFRAGAAASSPRVQTAAAAELPDPDYPFVLNTGRLLYHWHGGTMTRRVEGLLELAPRLEVALHPADARRLGVETGDPIRVTSRRGELDALRAPHRGGAPGRHLRPLRQAGRLGGELPHEFRPRPVVEDPRIQGLRGPHRSDPCRRPPGRIAAARRPRQERDAP